MNFNDEQVWKDYDADKQGVLRIEQLRKLIPEDVNSVLDAGCGNGIITNALAKEYTTTGLDPSAAALQYLTCPAVQASITEMPFPDASFDLVCCNEVLEHLNDRDLQLGVKELVRVSAKYLVISVPHEEQLAKLQIRCTSCGHTEHPYGHIQSFSKLRLDSLFAESFVPIEHKVFGPANRDFANWMLKIKQNYLGQWFSPGIGTLCSKCKSDKFCTNSNVLTKLVNAANRIVSKPRPYWLMVLYKRRGDIG